MTEEELKKFQHDCLDLTKKIAHMWDDVDVEIILPTLVPLVAQSVVNLAYARQLPTIDVLDAFKVDITDCTARLMAFKLATEKKNEA